jgi:hypothetical protein
LQNVKKEKDKKPLKFYSEKLLEALANDVPDDRQNADVVRDLKQVQNTLQRQHIKLRSGDDEIYHLIELKHETDFIHYFPLIKSSLASENVRISYGPFKF